MNTPFITLAVKINIKGEWMLIRIKHFYFYKSKLKGVLLWIMKVLKESTIKIPW